MARIYPRKLSAREEGLLARLDEGDSVEAEWIDTDGSSKTVSHNMAGSVIVEVVENSTGSTIYTDVSRPDNNTIVLSAAITPPPSGYHIIIRKA